MHTQGDIFYSRRSPMGQEKASLLSNERKVICIDSSLDPICRVNWECIELDMREGKANTVRIMRGAEKNSQLADVFEGLETRSNVECCFLDIFPHVFSKCVHGFNPDNGMDLDVILVMDDGPPWYWIEILPRFKKGEINSSYGCRWIFKAPYHTAPVQNFTDNIHCYIFGEMIGDEMRSVDRTEKWNSHKGPWCLRNKRMVQLFVDHALFSLIEKLHPTSKPMVFPGVKTEIATGKDLEALLYFGKSKG